MTNKYILFANTFLLLRYKDYWRSHQNISKLLGNSIFVQYLGVIDAFIRHFIDFVT